jgi:hypothetical protein
MEGTKDPSHLLDVEKRVYHASRPGFRIAEFTQSNAGDTLAPPHQRPGYLFRPRPRGTDPGLHARPRR